MQCGQATCCVSGGRGAGKVDDEGNGLLLNSESERGVGGGRGGGEQEGGGCR
jgi:hypothetical protein